MEVTDPIRNVQCCNGCRDTINPGYVEMIVWKGERAVLEEQSGRAGVRSVAGKLETIGPQIKILIDILCLLYFYAFCKRFLQFALWETVEE